MTLRFPWTLLLVLALAVGFVGCSDDDDDNPTGPGNGNGDDEVVQLNASSYTDWAYYNLAAGEESNADATWHVAFRRFEVMLNGGASGDGDVEVVNLTEMELADDYASLDAVPTLAEEDWTTDTAYLVFDGWYSYNPADHTTPATGRVFAMKDASGNGYAKVVVTEAVPGGMGALGTVSLKYVYDPDGTDLSGTEETVTLSTDGNGDAYFSFADGQVTAADSWDIWFEGYDAHINGGVSGDGSAGVYPAYDDPDYDDYDTMTTAPPDMGGSYEQDYMQSALTSWYTYNGQTHEVVSNEDVYLLRSGDSVFKFQITNYYKVEGGSAEAGWISFQYEAL